MKHIRFTRRFDRAMINEKADATTREAALRKELTKPTIFFNSLSVKLAFLYTCIQIRFRRIISTSQGCERRTVTWNKPILGRWFAKSEYARAAGCFNCRIRDLRVQTRSIAGQMLRKKSDYQFMKRMHVMYWSKPMYLAKCPLLTKFAKCFLP